MSAEAATTVLSIPTVIWSGAIAALVSLAGVVLSNRNSLDRLNAQLRHDANEKHRDRIAELRRDVYLDLTTQLTSASAHLGSLAGKDPTTEDLTGALQSAIAGLAKAQLIGSRETAALASELTTLYGETLFKLIASAKPLYDLKIDIKIADDMYNQQYAQAQRIIAELTAINESGNPNPARMEALQRSFEHYRDSYTAYADERSTAWDSYNSHNLTFVRATFQEIQKIAPLQIKLACSVRSEIGLDTDASDLFKRLEDNRVRMEQAAEALLSVIDHS